MRRYLPDFHDAPEASVLVMGGGTRGAVVAKEFSPAVEERAVRGDLMVLRMSEADCKELKKCGMIRQAEAGLFAVRLHVVGGRLATPQLRAIQDAADRFGRGEIHLTGRQGVEIPHVSQGALAAVKEFLAPSGVGVGVSGPTVRTVTACQGCRVCPGGVIDSPELAEAVDRELYGKPVPHKFKIGISGCVNNCMKAEENDVGIKGWIEPRWEAPACTICGVCQAVCPAKAISTSGDGGTLIVDPTLCIGCGDCLSSCPTGSMREKIRGYRVFVGGKFGRRPSLGRRILGVLRTKEEAMAAILAVLDFFREHGKPRERFGDTLQRTGLPALESFVKVKMGLQRVPPLGTLTVRPKEEALKSVISSLKTEGHRVTNVAREEGVFLLTKGP
jgi:dissimilatory sulfite reductase (desulfoviridin) alpha/beta subunit